MNRSSPSASLRVTTTVYRSHNDRHAARLASTRAGGPSPVDVLDEYLAGAPFEVRAAWRALRASVRP
jgi:hypothetical protein